MVDPFEARLQFIKLLQRLNATLEANRQAGQFLIRHVDLCEDLYSCILEELDKSPSNVRLNILYFIETLISEFGTTSIRPMIKWAIRDLHLIFTAVVPLSRMGLVNFSAAQTMIQNILPYCAAQTRAQLTSLLQEREALVSADSEGTSVNERLGDGAVGTGSLISPGMGAGEGGEGAAENQILGLAPSNIGSSTASPAEPVPALTKEEILRRMNEDRERSKRLKENIWAVDYRVEYSEFNDLWQTSSGLTELDYEQMKEDNEMARMAKTLRVTM